MKRTRESLRNSKIYVQDYLLFTGRTIEDIIIQENCMNDELHPSDFVHELIYRNLMKSIGLGVSICTNLEFRF
ncbi:hypothetical protein [Inconstantimicrobium porci]|uniref:Uncharacterized protein n=1 Tax=Inconstantimicrobium porci TaxID=2652291 RepID=A0A7X2MWJ3_9CLOT|nr:hypothetical protein [Inconstantimicrobium porci]MSR90397.1 hypothetical protein [Inconstantimicrobium porci]